MKQTILRKLMLIAVLLTSSHAFAHDFEVDGIYYNILSEDDKIVKVTYKGGSYSNYNNEYTGSVVIPTSVTYNSKTYSVASIGDYAFYDCDGLTSVTIPNSVTRIGECAFFYSKGLTSVSIPNSVTSIGDNAFSNCTGLTSVTIGNGVTEIGSFAFKYCKGLTSITIPNGVTSIGDNAFSDCDGLTTINFNAENCTTMGSASYSAFYLCRNITTINIGNNVKTIPDYAFYQRYKLTSITIPNGVTSIGDCAFSGCTGLTSITIPNSVTTIGNLAFSSCTGLTEVTIGNSVTSIGNYAFSSCTGLTKIHIEESNATYDSRENCNAIIETASNTLISGCSNTVIPNSVTSIGDNAFDGCSGLTEITIPNSVTSIGDYAFNYCKGLTEIICESSTPATAYSHSFSYIPTTATLYVPVGSREAYSSATGWNNFTNIIEDDLKTGVESTLADNVNVSIENGNIVVTGADNTKIEVYSVNGQCVYSGNATTIPVSAKGLYIVKVNGKSFKVML